MPGFSYVIEETQSLNAAWTPMAGGFAYGDGSTVRKFITHGPMPGDGGPPPTHTDSSAKPFRLIPWTITMASDPGSSLVHIKRQATDGFAAWDRVMDLPLPRMAPGAGGAPPPQRTCYALDYSDETASIWNEPTVKTASAQAPQSADTLPSAGDQEEYELHALLEVREQLIAWLDYGNNPPQPDTTPRPRKFVRVRRIGAADSNNNGIPDWQELRWGFPVFTTGIDPNGDADGDGRTNIQEMSDGTDPRQADPPDLNLLAGWRNMALHKCKTSSTAPEANHEEADNRIKTYSKGPISPAPAWSPSTVAEDLRNVWTAALANSHNSADLNAAPFGAFENADYKRLLSFTEGRYSATPVNGIQSTAAYSPPIGNPGNYHTILDGRGEEYAVKLQAGKASPADITRRFILLQRYQPDGAAITDAVNNASWNTWSVAPICDSTTTLTVRSGQTVSASTSSYPALPPSVAQINRLELPALGTVPSGKQLRAERCLAEISLLADTSRDGSISPKDQYSLQPAVYTVNYGFREGLTLNNYPIEDAIHWTGVDELSGSTKLYWENGEQKRRIEARNENWVLPILSAAAPLPPQFSPLRIPWFPFGHRDMKVFLRLPSGDEAKAKAFHLYIAKTNNTSAPVPSTTKPGTNVPPGSREWIPLLGGASAPTAATPGVPSNVGEVWVEITKWINPSATGYVDSRPASAFNDTNPPPYELALEGILFKGMPYPGSDGIARYGNPASPNPVFDGILRLGIEYHQGNSNPASNTPDPANKEKSSAAIGQASDWVTLSCVPSIPLKMDKGTPVLDTVPSLPAFKSEYQSEYSAHGYGKYAIGGRYGNVFTVTKNTDDANDPQTLRYAIESPVPRTILFALPEGMDGNIELNRDLFIKDRQCTIAGQTSFRNGSYGICLKKYGLRVGADDVIVRYFRSRPGNIDPAVNGEGGNTDSFSVEGVASNVIFDHCSASFSSDCLMDIATGKKLDKTYYQRENRRVTAQYCLLGWPMDEANHVEDYVYQKHGYATLARSGRGGGVSLWRNFYGHCRTRIPRPAGIIDNVPDPTGLRLDFINNVIYGWGDKKTENVDPVAGYDDPDKDIGKMAGQFNLVGNYYRTRLSLLGDGKYWFKTKNAYGKGWLSGNSTNGYLESNQYSASNVTYDPGSLAAGFQTTGPFPSGTSGEFAVPTSDAGSIWVSYRQKMGANMKTDRLDAQLLAESSARSGTMIDSPSEVGGWPSLPAMLSPKDTDGDGLPDEPWDSLSTTMKTDPRTSLLDDDHDYYTNLEEYLSNITPH